MSESIIGNYSSASFKSFSFLTPSESETGGPKTAVHEYMNSDECYVEELGLYPSSFDMPCIFHGVNAFSDRIQFKSLLDEGGIGTLIHPIYGQLQVKVEGKYTISSDQKNIGQFIFKVKFRVSREEAVIPTKKETGLGQVTVFAEITRSTLLNKLEEELIEENFTDKLIATANKVTEFTQDMVQFMDKIIAPIQENVAAFMTVANSVQSSIITIVQQPFKIKSAFEELYSGYLDIVDIPTDLKESWNLLIDFNTYDSSPDSNVPDPGSVPSTLTVAKAMIAQDTRIIDTNIQLTALASSFESYAYTEFKTENEIIEARNFLEEKYKNRLLLPGSETGEEVIGSLEETLALEYVGEKDLTLDPEVRDAFAKLRVSVLEVLNQKIQNVWRVKTVYFKRSSISLLTYQYFGTVDYIDSIYELNKPVNPSILTQEAKMIAK